MILLNNDGKSVPEIALMLKRNQHTIRDWLKRYRDQGIKGLNRKYSPGRPDTVRQIIKRHLVKILGNPPTLYGYQDNAWTIPLITFEVNKSLNINASSKTVTRALKNMGYVYKRPSKTVPGHAPSKEEKQKAVKKIVQDILKIIDQKESVIYALDESHFSTEPYLVRGWFKKRWPPQDPNTHEKRKSHILWLLGFKDTEILLEKVDQVE
jgi:transposase